jgi:hypothetical protein
MPDLRVLEEKIQLAQSAHHLTDAGGFMLVLVFVAPIFILSLTLINTI